MRWLERQVMDALIPTGGSLPGVLETDLDGFLDRFHREAGPLLRLGLFAGIWAFVFTPLFTVGWPLPSFLVPRAARLRHAAKLCAHPLYPLRQLVFVVKMVAGLCWGEDPKVRAVLALPPYARDPGTWRET